MARLPVHLPELGTSPVRFGLWLVEPGDAVYAGDRLAEVLIAGASVDVNSPATGKLVERIAWPRDLLQPGQVLGFVESDPEETP